MDLINTVIIYFALGVPFGVLSVYLRNSRIEAAHVVLVFYNLAFWPLIALHQVATKLRRLRSVAPHNHFRKNYELPSDRTRRQRLFNQRSVLLGLEHALESAGAAQDLRLPYLEAIDHPDPTRAAACFQRRKIALLERNLSEARNAYSKMVVDARTDGDESYSRSAYSVEPNVSAL
jgi:hypothetical protein